MRTTMKYVSSFVALSFVALAACNSDPAPAAQQDAIRPAGDGGAAGDASGGGAAGTTQQAGTGGTQQTAGTGGTAQPGGAGGTAAAGAGQAGGTVDPMGGGGNQYPAGPFGLDLGDVVQNFKFYGLLDPSAVNYDANKGNTIEFRDFYNPTGDTSKPRVLVVTASARWCTYCKDEASKSMTNYKYWNDKGVEFLTAVFQDDQYNPAQFADLNKWTSTYKLGYPVVLDPAPPQLGVFFNLDAAPFNMVLDLTTMKILFKVAGEVDLGPTNGTLKQATGG